jgi:hypothetical protein
MTDAQDTVFERFWYGILSIALLLSIAAMSRADDLPVKIVPKPEMPKLIEFRTPPGVPIKLSSGNGSKWSLVGDYGTAEIFPCPMGETCSFVAPRAGQYFLTVQSGELTHRLVVIVQPEQPPEPMPPPMPKPPEPKPPEPIPPVPVPVPVPPKPVPVDPLVAKLQVAYLLDIRPEARRKQDLLDLVELYGQASALAGKPEIKTVGALITQIRNASAALGIVGLVDLRKAISVELAAEFPIDDPLTDTARKRAGDTFARIQSALKGVSNAAQ